MEKALMRLEAAKRASRLGVYDFDLRTGQLEWDDRMRELWGLPADETVTYDTFLDGLHPDDRAPTQAAIDRAFDPGGNGEFAAEYRVINRRDGMERWIAATGRVYFEGRQPIRLIGTAADVTARRKAEQALTAKEAQLRTILETVPVGIVLAELPSGRIVD